jgi:DNA-binding transcriptional LysR family regulator
MLSMLYISIMNDREHLDLNLLRAFDAIRRTQSVTAAAGALGITQPSLSNALARLRERLGDPLFVRTASGMKPTPLAERLAAPVRDALGLVDQALAAPVAFDPASAVRDFRISTSDLGETILLPPLIQAVQAQAGRIRIESHPVAHRGLAQALESGELDLAMGALGRPARGVREHFLFADPYVCVLRAGHPAARPRLGIPALRTLRFAVVVPEETVHAQVEAALRRARLLDRVAVRSAHFLSVPAILELSDLASIVPERIARHFCRDGRLTLAGLPLDLEPVRVALSWHQRFDRDPASVWLRTLAMRLAGAEVPAVAPG